MRHKVLLVGAVAAMAAGTFFSFRAVGVETVPLGVPVPAEVETPVVVEAIPVVQRPFPSANPRDRRATFRPPAGRGVRPAARSVSTRLAPRPRATLPVPKLAARTPKPLSFQIPAGKRTKAAQTAPAPIPAPAPPEETAATLISASSPPPASKTAAGMPGDDAGSGESAKPRAEAKPASGGTTNSIDDAMPDLDGDAKKKKNNKPRAHAKAKTPQASGGEAGGGEAGGGDGDGDRGRDKKVKAKQPEKSDVTARADDHEDRDDDKHGGEGDDAGQEHGKSKGKDKKDRGDGAADE